MRGALAAAVCLLLIASAAAWPIEDADSSADESEILEPAPDQLKPIDLETRLLASQMLEFESSVDDFASPRRAPAPTLRRTMVAQARAPRVPAAPRRPGLFGTGLQFLLQSADFFRACSNNAPEIGAQSNVTAATAQRQSTGAHSADQHPGQDILDYHETAVSQDDHEQVELQETACARAEGAHGCKNCERRQDGQGSGNEDHEVVTSAAPEAGQGQH